MGHGDKDKIVCYKRKVNLSFAVGKTHRKMDRPQDVTSFCSWTSRPRPIDIGKVSQPVLIWFGSTFIFNISSQKTTSWEDDLTGRRPHWKSVRRPNRKTASPEEGTTRRWHSKRRPQRKTGPALLACLRIIPCLPLPHISCFITKWEVFNTSS